VIDEWLDRNPGGKVVVCEGTASSTRQLEVAYDNSCDGYHVAYFAPLAASRPKNRFAGDNAKGHVVLQESPDASRCTCATPATANHFKGQAAELEKRPGGLWALNRRTPAWSTTRRSSSAATATAPMLYSISPAPSR